MDNQLSRSEHNELHGEFSRRMDAENTRQNKRLDLLEKNIDRINDLTISVEKMAVDMRNILEEVKKQGERLGTLEKEPAETSKQIRLAIITAIAGTVAGAVVTAVLMIL